MATVELLMPKMGESVMEGTVLSWLKNAGESIEEDESILEVATDKVDTEIPSTHAGVLKEILAKEGDVIQVGQPLAKIETEAGDPTQAPLIEEEKAKEVVARILKPQAKQVNSQVLQMSPEISSTRFYSPLVKNIAKAEHIPFAELEQISGTGKESRVTKQDILAYVEQRKAGHTPILATNGKSQQDSPSVFASGEDEIIEMDRMRKMIAERMLSSKATSAHVTSFVEADMTDVVHWRSKMKHYFKEREGQNLTFTPMIIEAVVKAIKDYPMINIQVDGVKIIRKGQINIGMAVALPTGNLIVPVIHQADKMNLIGLTQKVNDLAKRARENALKPDELSGGTFTISNVGSFGNVMGTPIIVQPQVAILALGAIQKKPAVIETNKGDFIGIRHKMFLSHSYDHRVVDGALGGMFVRRVADYLEKFDSDRNI